MLIHVDTELAAKDLLNSRMAYVAVSRGAEDAQVYTNDRETLPEALGHDVSHESAHVPTMKPEQSTKPPQPEIASVIEHSMGMGIASNLPAPDDGSVAQPGRASRPQPLCGAGSLDTRT